MTDQHTDQHALSGVWADAHAKINLFLHITGRRDDGYHRLQSVFAFTALRDSLFARPSGTIELDLSGPMAPDLRRTRSQDCDDLVIRAVHALRDWAEARDMAVGGAAIDLDKHLPVAGGIGGGSADAAAALRAMKVLWKLTVSDEELSGIAAQLGADIPACLSSRLQWVEGIGERCFPLDSEQAPFCLLVNCGKAVNTGRVFQRYANSKDQFTGMLDRSTVRDPLDTHWLERTTANDLESHAIAECPEIADCLQALRDQEKCRLARMSGSGPTCFGLFPTREAAEHARGDIAARHPGWWLWAGPLIRLSR